jgi:hypothetical protein
MGTTAKSGQTAEQGALSGFITERHFAEAEEAFPGIAAFYASCSPRPRTFLDLVAEFVRRATPMTAASNG